MWTDISPPPSFNLFTANALYESSGILYAGGQGGVGVNFCWKYDTEWTDITLTLPGSINAMTASNGILYAGGYDFAGQTFCHAYSSSTWTSLGLDIAQNRTKALCVYNGILYAGCSNPGSFVQSYDTTNPAGWVDLDYPGFGLTSVYVHSGILYAGGYSFPNTTVYAYDITNPSGGWTNTNLPSSGIVNALYGINTLLYAGGQNNEGSAFVQSYDPSNSSWTDTSLNMSGANALSVNVLYTLSGILYAGGQDGSGNAFVQLYDPSNPRWTDTSFATPGSVVACAGSSSYLYAGGTNEGTTGFVKSMLFLPPPPPPTPPPSWTGANVQAIDNHDGTVSVSWVDPSAAADSYSVVDALNNPYPNQTIQDSSAIVSGLFHAAQTTCYILATYSSTYVGTARSDSSASLILSIPNRILAGFQNGDINQLTQGLAVCGFANPNSTSIYSFAYDGSRVYVATYNTVFLLHPDLTVDTSYTFAPDYTTDMVYGDKLYVGSNEGSEGSSYSRIYSMDASLNIDTSFQFVEDTVNALAYGGNRLYVGTGDGIVYSMNASLQIDTSYQFLGDVIFCLTYGGNKVYAGTNNGFIYSMDASLHIDASHQFLEESVACLTYGGNKVYAGTNVGVIYSMDASLNIDTSRYFIGDSIIALTYGDKLYAITAIGWVYSLDRATLVVDSSYNNPADSYGYQHSILYISPMSPTPPTPPPNPPTKYIKPLSSKAIRAANRFPSTSMRLQAIAGRELIRTLQGGAKKYNKSADIVTTYDQGRAYILGRTP